MEIPLNFRYNLLTEFNKNVQAVELSTNMTTTIQRQQREREYDAKQNFAGWIQKEATSFHSALVYEIPTRDVL